MEYDEQEEEMGMPAAAVAVPTFDSLGNLVARSKINGGEGRKGAFGAAAVRYRECQKNHAVSFGGNAVDGCCEFMAAGEDGTLEAVICAACNCHRNFHRKEIDGEITTFLNRAQPPPSPLHHHQFSPHYQHSFLQHPAAAGYFHHHLATPPVSQHRPLALPAASSGGGLNPDEEDMSNPISGGGGSKKRLRTKFTQEQKDKMLAFAEQVGWRIQKHDESALEQFCAETNVKRNVLRVWMHNNKNTLGKKP